ncbi:MAG: hypothetical protein HC831_06415 [Chloroflexia bacterium]|nr:hypothetical protein [Chloroflexia bacterium]
MDNQYMHVVEFFAENPSQFMWQVFVPIGLWLIIVLGFFVLLLKKYTFGKWSDENPNPYAGETFDMPRGVFRGTLTLTLVYVVVVLELVNVRIIGFEDEIHELMVAFQMMIAFYFGSKVMHHMSSTDRKKTEVFAQNVGSLQSKQTETEDFDDESAAG